MCIYYIYLYLDTLLTCNLCVIFIYLYLEKCAAVLPLMDPPLVTTNIEF